MSDLTHLEKYGPSLLRLGYDVVPIMAGTKACKLPEWQTVVATENQICSWMAAYTGCGIRGPRTVGVDMDCRDENLTQHMLNFVQQRLGPVPYRIGMPPKALLPYRCESYFRKIKSPEFFSSDGQKHQLEVLAEGQQFVTAHIHPDTGKPYIWHYADGAITETLTVPWQDLPVITEDDARAIVAEFVLHAEGRGWRRKGGTNKEVQYSARSHVPREYSYTENDIRDMLSFINPTEYDVWLKVVTCSPILVHPQREPCRVYRRATAARQQDAGGMPPAIFSRRGLPRIPAASGSPASCAA
jgi:Bifunctional DNA primase/polymerase, N-terminal